MKTSHHHIENSGSSLKVIINNPRPLGQIVMTGVMLIILPVFLTLFFKRGSSSFLVIMFIGSLLFWEVWAIYYFLVLLFGREIIEVRDNSWKVDKLLFWFRRSQEYPYRLIQTLRVLPNMYAREYRDWPLAEIWWDKGDGTIAFQAGPQEVRFGRWLDQWEAQQIVDVIQKYNNEKTGN